MHHADINRQDTWQDYNHAPVQFEDFFESTKMEDDPLAAWDLGPDEVGPGEAVEIVPSEIPPAPVTESRQNDVEAEKGKLIQNPSDRATRRRTTLAMLSLSASGTTTTARFVYVMLLYCSHLLCCTALLCLPCALL